MSPPPGKKRRHIALPFAGAGGRVSVDFLNSPRIVHDCNREGISLISHSPTRRLLRHGRGQSVVHLASALSALLLALAIVPARAQPESQATNPSLKQRMHQAVQFADNGDFQHAMQITEQMLQEYPDFVPALKLKGMLLEQTGRMDEAGTAYDQALKLAPNDPDILLKAGINKLATGHKEDALTLLLHCTEISPGNGDAEYYLAQAYHFTGHDDLALRAIQKSEEDEPDNASIKQKYGELLCGAGNCADGLNWLLQAKKADPTLPRLNYDLGWAEYSLMDLIHAEEDCQRAVDESPNDVQALRLLASVEVKLEHWQQADSAFERILAVNGPDEDVLLGLGHCEVELKNYPAAIQHLQAVLHQNPTVALAHFYLSRALAATGKTADAQREAALHHLMIEQATFVGSRVADQRENAIRDQARQLLTEHNEQAALDLYREHFKGESIPPGDAYVFVGKTYLSMGDTENALRALEHALKIEPNVRGAHTQQGIVALKRGDLPKAESELKADLANDPNDQLAIAELGELRYRQRRWSEAVEQIKRSHTMAPDLLYKLCDSYLHLGKMQDADLTAELAAAYGRDDRQLMQDLLAMLRKNGRTEAAERIDASLKP